MPNPGYTTDVSNTFLMITNRNYHHQQSLRRRYYDSQPAKNSCCPKLYTRNRATQSVLLETPLRNAGRFLLQQHPPQEQHSPILQHRQLNHRPSIDSHVLDGSLRRQCRYPPTFCIGQWSNYSSSATKCKNTNSSKNNDNGGRTGNPEKSSVSDDVVEKAHTEPKEVPTSVAEPPNVTIPNEPVVVATTATATTTATRMGGSASEAVSAATHELELRIKRVVGDVTIGDQMSVVLIAIFTTILLCAPFAVRHMKQRANTYGYDDRLQTDDPVDEFAKLARREWGMGADNVVEDDDDVDGNGENGTTDRAENSGQNKKFVELLLKDVLQSSTVQDATQEFVVQIIQSERFKEAISRFVKELWSDLVTDPETIAQVIRLLEIAIQSEPIKKAVMELILQIAVRETEFRTAILAMIEGLGQDDTVRKAVALLLTDAAHTTLNDPDILDHSMEFATDVVGDDIVQQTAGEALRKSVEHAVKPATTILLTACGVGFLIFSFVALGYSRSSETEAVLFESAARSLQTNAATGMLRIVTWPFRAIQNGISGTILSVGGWIVSHITTLPDWRTPLHRASSAAYNVLCTFAMETVALPCRGIKTVAYWIASMSTKLVQQVGSNIRQGVISTSKAIAALIGTAFCTLVKAMEYNSRTVASHMWLFTVTSTKQIGAQCGRATARVGSNASTTIINFVASVQRYWRRITSDDWLDPLE
jgi:hypothetical protein